MESKKEKIEIIQEQSKEISSKFLGRVVPQKNHILFEVNLKNGDIIPAVFDKEIEFGTEFDPLKKKITQKPDCIYVSALNKKNVNKILMRNLKQN